MPCDGLTHDDLAGCEVAKAEGLPGVVSTDAEHDALGLAWRQLVLGFGSPQVPTGSKRNEVVECGPVSDTDFLWGDTGVEGGCRAAVLHFAGGVHGFHPKAVVVS